MLLEQYSGSLLISQSALGGDEDEDPGVLLDELALLLDPEENWRRSLRSLELSSLNGNGTHHLILGDLHCRTL